MPLFNQHVLMSDAHNFRIDQPINPYYHQDKLDDDKAVSEHDSIKNLLEQSGVRVTTVASPKNCQDGVYTANWALIRGKKAILARLPNARKGEEDYAEKILTDLGLSVTRVPGDYKFSGQGDALACGNYLFCGSTYRSDEQAQEFAADELGYDRIQLRTIPLLDESSNEVINKASGWADSFFYDIDLAIAIIKQPTENEKGLIAFCPEAFTDESVKLIRSLDDIEKIEVSIDEAEHAFATNLVSTGKVVIMNGQATKLVADLKNHGLQVVSPNPHITELAKGGGFIRCTTLTLS